MATQPNQPILQIDHLVREQIEQLAASRKTTPEEIVRKAVEYYAYETETNDEFLKRGLAALAEYEETGLHLTGEEVDEWLAKIEAGENPPMPPCTRNLVARSSAGPDAAHRLYRGNTTQERQAC